MYMALRQQAAVPCGGCEDENASYSWASRASMPQMPVPASLHPLISPSVEPFRCASLAQLISHKVDRCTLRIMLPLRGITMPSWEWLSTITHVPVLRQQVAA